MAAKKVSAKQVSAKKAPAKTAAKKVAAKKVPDVLTFLAALEHPHKAEIVLLREIILAADASVVDEIKWNAPSFRTSEFFATTNLRAKTGTSVILHFGAKKRDIAPRSAIADPGRLLQWLADDRAMVSFASVADLESRRAEFSALIRSWIRFL